MSGVGETVINLNESILREQIQMMSLSGEYNNIPESYWDDIACLALNKIPAKYICNPIDMFFYYTPDEVEEMHDKVKAVIMDTIEFLLNKHK